MYDDILCMYDGILCMHDGKLCMHDGKLCMHDGMLDPKNAIDMLEMLCTLNSPPIHPISSLLYSSLSTRPCGGLVLRLHALLTA